MSNCCINEHDFCIVRGDVFEMTIGLVSHPKIMADKPDFHGHLVIREIQDDSAPVLAEADSAVGDLDDDRFEDPKGSLTFKLEPATTQALPPYDVVAYCEVRQVSTGYRTRLFNSRVRISD